MYNVSRNFRKHFIQGTFNNDLIFSAFLPLCVLCQMHAVSMLTLRSPLRHSWHIGHSFGCHSQTTEKTKKKCKWSYQCTFNSLDAIIFWSDYTLHSIFKQIILDEEIANIFWKLNWRFYGVRNLLERWSQFQNDGTLTSV